MWDWACQVNREALPWGGTSPPSVRPSALGLGCLLEETLHETRESVRERLIPTATDDVGVEWGAGQMGGAFQAGTRELLGDWSHLG